MADAQQRRRITIAGAVLVAAGGLLGLAPVSADDIPCGTPWFRSYEAADLRQAGRDIAEAITGQRSSRLTARELCEEAGNTRGGFGAAAAILGALALLGAALTSSGKDETPPAPPRPAGTE